MHTTISQTIERARPSIVRILVRHKDASKGVFAGTGFCIRPGIIITCAHVLLFHPRLDLLLKELKIPLKDGEKALHDYFQKNIQSVIIELPNGQRMKAKRCYFQGAHDVALIECSPSAALKTLNGMHENINVGERVFFAGFPYTIQTPTEKFPFAVHQGSVTSIVHAAIGGFRKRSLLQCDFMALGGSSGSPLFSAETGALVGMINGHMTWGADRVAIMDDAQCLSPDDIYIPLPVAYATSIRTVMKHVQLLTRKI